MYVMKALKGLARTSTFRAASATLAATGLPP